MHLGAQNHDEIAWLLAAFGLDSTLREPSGARAALERLVERCRAAVV